MEVDLVSAYPQSAIRGGGILVREFHDGDESALARLNEPWIGKSFRLEDKDRATLQSC